MVSVYIGTERAQLLCAKVLEFTIRKHCKSVEIFYLDQFDLHGGLVGARTPFSFQRLFVPSLPATSSQQLYLDSDMLVFDDLAALLATCSKSGLIYGVSQPKDGRANQSSFLYFNDVSYDRGPTLGSAIKLAGSDSSYYNRLVNYFDGIWSDVEYSIDATWNSLEFRDHNTKTLHFTDMESQPWLYGAHPLNAVWITELSEAVEQNVISHNEIVREINLGHVRPSLVRDLHCKSGDRRLYLLNDLFWYPPGTIFLSRPVVGRCLAGRNKVIRRLTGLALRVYKCFSSPRERLLTFRLMKEAFSPYRPTQFGCGIFKDYN